MGRKDNSGNEGAIVTDGRNIFRIINGRRVWLTPPPPLVLSEIFDDQRKAHECSLLRR
jgi:hypothetical protein